MENEILHFANARTQRMEKKNFNVAAYGFQRDYYIVLRVTMETHFVHTTTTTRLNESAFVHFSIYRQFDSFLCVLFGCQSKKKHLHEFSFSQRRHGYKPNKKKVKIVHNFQ